MGKNKQVLCKVCYRSMRSNNLKRHLQVHMRFKETVDQNTKGDHSAVVCNDTLLVKVDIKHGRNKNRQDSEKDDCNNEDEHMTEGKYLQTNTEGLRKRMIVKDKEYSDKVKLGGEVYEISIIFFQFIQMCRKSTQRSFNLIKTGKTLTYNNTTKCNNPIPKKSTPI